jgi:4,5-dihydroxyphthalate decarboxylase
MTITIEGADYEHTLGLGGRFRGLDLVYRTRPTREIFADVLARKPFQVAEYSLANALILLDQGADWLRPVAVFPYRAFRHATLLVRRDSALTDPAALRGKRVGVPDYSMTAAVWSRGIFLEEYGLDWRAVDWVSAPDQRFPIPTGANVTIEARDLEDLLLAGEIDALMTPVARDGLRPAEERKLRPLLPDARGVEERYFRRTGRYPINHTVVVHAETAAAHPGCAGAVFDAFAAAKDAAYRRRLATTLLPWGRESWGDTFALFGGDPLPYGLTAANRANVAALAGYLLEQGFIRRLPNLETLFAAS